MNPYYDNISHDELIAEIRKRQDLRGGDLVDNFHIEDGEYGEWSGLELLKAYAECLDKAHKREIVETATKAATYAINLTEQKWRRECADMAKLRETLHEIGKACAWISDNCNDTTNQTQQYMQDIIVKVKSALAAPARNCDVFTPEVLFNEFINEMPEEVEKKITKSERDLIELTAKGVIGTLFAPYDPEEGGNKK